MWISLQTYCLKQMIQQMKTFACILLVMGSFPSYLILSLKYVINKSFPHFLVCIFLHLLSQRLNTLLTLSKKNLIVLSFYSIYAGITILFSNLLFTTCLKLIILTWVFWLSGKNSSVGKNTLNPIPKELGRCAKRK